MLQEISLTSLNKLSLQQKKTFQRYDFLENCDQTIHLDENLKNCWKKLLASVSTTESLEDIIITKIMAAFTNNEKKLNYLKSQKNDESIHTSKLINYNLQTFKYKKIKKSICDKIIYGVILKNVSNLFQKKPIYGLSVLLFFEIYGVQFYKKLGKSSKQHHLSELGKLIDQITQDEERHIAGIKILLTEEKKAKSLNFIDKIAIKLILSICILDLNMSKYAFHNTEVRKNILMLGIDPDELTIQAKKTAKLIMKSSFN